MSHTLIKQTLRATTCVLLATEIKNFLEEQIPEFTCVYTSKTSTTGITHYFEYKTLGLGIGVKGSHTSSAKYIYLGTANGMSSSGATDIPSWYNTSPKTTDVSGTTYYEITCAVIKTSVGYVIRVGDFVHYFYEADSVLDGRRYIYSLLNLNTTNHSITIVNCDKCDKRTDYTKIFNEDGEYFVGTLISVVPDDTVTEVGKAILTPIFSTQRSVFAEPLLVPDLYFMTAYNYPAELELATIGDTEGIYLGYNLFVV